MRLLRLICLLLVLMLPLLALADKTISISFAGDVTLGGEERLASEPNSFASVYENNGPEYFLQNFADFFAEDDQTIGHVFHVTINTPEAIRCNDDAAAFFHNVLAG